MDTDTAPARSGPLKVYLVEDSEPVRLRMTKLLQGIGGVQVVGGAESPAPALRDISRLAPDFIVVDMQLKDGTGLEVLHGLAGAGNRAVSAVVTNTVMGPLARASHAAGARFVFDKTTELDQLLLTVRSLADARWHSMSPIEQGKPE